MSKYLLKQSTKKKTKQSQAIPGREREMQRNNAGGYAFTADSFTRLERFLILGSEGGTYYVGEQDLTKQNIDNVRACIAQDGLRAVRMITDISVAGRAPKNDPALYALAVAITQGVVPYAPKTPTQRAALDAIPKVARTGTHLFTLMSFLNAMGGWGPAVRKAIAEWYLSKPAEKLAYQLCKYQQRNGWTHRDVLRLVHPKADLDTGKSLLFRWAVKGSEGLGDEPPKGAELLWHFERAKTASEQTLCKLIREHGLTREMIPTEHQKSPKVWEVLLEKMPLHAMIRTLGRMGASGLLAPLSDASKLVCERLGDAEYLRKSRVHPIAVLSAMLTYGQGHGERGKLKWDTVPVVVDALDGAFYSSFTFVEPTGKNFYLGVDVSGSMASGGVAGLPNCTPNMGAAAMAMLIARTEPSHFIGGFSTRFVDLKVSSRDRLDSAMRKCQRDFGGTDCAVAIKHALANKVPVDAFVVISDGETWAGDTHASQAIQDFRSKMGRDAKLIVMNMVANRTSLSDPKDSGSLDVIGFDASVPVVIGGFLGAERPAQANEEAEAE